MKCNIGNIRKTDRFRNPSGLTPMSLEDVKLCSALVIRRMNHEGIEIGEWEFHSGFYSRVGGCTVYDVVFINETTLRTFGASIAPGRGSLLTADPLKQVHPMCLHHASNEVKYHDTIVDAIADPLNLDVIVSD